MTDRFSEEDVRPLLTKQAAELATRVIQAGADAAEVLLVQGTELSVKVRQGLPELVKEASQKALGLRVFSNHRTAVTYTSDFSKDGLDLFFQNSVSLCKLSEPDLLNELPAPEEFARSPLPDLHLWDEAALLTTPKEALEIAKVAEAAALAHPQVTNSEGASYDRTTSAKAFACADKQGLWFSGASRGTYQSLLVEPLCDDSEGKKRNGYYYTAHRFVSELLSPEEVGKEAARRTAAKLGSRPIPTQSLPIVFAPDAGRSLLQLLLSVISGGAIYRQASYLYGKEHTQIASPCINVVDDPLLPMGLGSRPFDGEGLASRVNPVVQEGLLTTYLLDTYSARKLHRRSNGCAARSIGGSPHVSSSNFILCPGQYEHEALFNGIEVGLYVTDMMGFGFNPVTGDFSRGAAGFLIDRGRVTTPVSEVTISANFGDLLHRIDAVGNTLDTRSSIMTPPFRVSQMMVAGT